VNSPSVAHDKLTHRIKKTFNDRKNLDVEFVELVSVNWPIMDGLFRLIFKKIFFGKESLFLT